MSAEIGARLTLASVTPSAECWGSGGNYADPGRQETLVEDASEHLEGLKREIGIAADLFAGSGDASKVLSQAARISRKSGNTRIRDYQPSPSAHPGTERVRTPFASRQRERKTLSYTWVLSNYRVSRSGI
jgi:hypothetical protein